MDINLTAFLSIQKVLSIATVSKNHTPWLCNVYFSHDDENLYFLSSIKSNHSKHIEINPNVAFALAWSDPDNEGNRNGIQGKGTCTKVVVGEELENALEVHLGKYPTWKNNISLESIKTEQADSKLYKIKIEYIKFWSDEHYPEPKFEEFNF
jgi:uncharacterized protein YhbP (UPF0306 family)